MQWEELTASEFHTAVHTTGICIIAMGVIEKHSEHLPLGTDYLAGHRLACLAAQREPAVVFPPFYFGQIYEARCFPGTITLRPTLLLDVIQGVFDEIGRNGFQKIMVFNAHGGNTHLLSFLSQCALWDEKPYALYLPTSWLTPEGEKTWAALQEAPYGGHADEFETSLMLGLHPELVKSDRIPEHPARPLERLCDLPPTHTGIGWYSNYPDHYAGDARTATPEKGRTLVELLVDNLARYIAAVKADTVVPTLTREFFDHAARLAQ